MVTPEQVIRVYAPRFGLDWRAVRAYALEESSGRWGAVGDHGTSFGPFQMHRGGALGQHTAQWAESPAGLIAGMRMMAATPIRGKTGAAALQAIYTYFGKGSNNAAAYARALPYLSGGTFPAGTAAAGTPPSGDGGVPTMRPTLQLTPTGLDRATLTRGLLGAFKESGAINTSALMAAISDARQVAQQAAPLHDVVRPSTQTATTGMGTYPTDYKGAYPKMVTGGKSPYSNLSFAQQADWQHVDATLLTRMNVLARRLGVTITIISGYRSPGYSAAHGGYGSDPHTRGVAVDAYVNGVPVGHVPQAVQLMHELGLETGMQPNFYRGKPDPEHVQVPGSGINKRIHARRTHAPWR